MDKNDVRMQKFDFVKTVKTIERWRKLVATVVTTEESHKIITASARSINSCGSAPAK